MSPPQRLATLLHQLSLQPTAATSTDSFTCIKTETQGRVGIITLHRPQALNALNSTLLAEVAQAILRFDAVDSGQGCIVITGSGSKSFAAGADIKEMSSMRFIDQFNNSARNEPWNVIKACKIPIIAAVNGFAFGGGCELAMMCDIIYASEKATFGQPEIKLGIIPGAGGTQRLIRSVGKSKAMEMCLSGNPITAQQAEAAGLVSKVVPADKLMEETLKLATQIASLSLPSVKICKSAVNSANETGLEQGLKAERLLFQQTFALEDKMIGTKAFVDKKKPQWSHS